MNKMTPLKEMHLDLVTKYLCRLKWANGCLMRINTHNATKVWKGFSLSFTWLHNVRVPILPFLLGITMLS